ncbi:MAG: HEAT repeat domain-containing protein [Candidatus Dadabacteria bacterium]|nr:HEAT repeat domain-containing protein [Candidatus Dadabacteria bacterium]
MSPQQTQFSNRLRAAFEASQLEDGMNHPAERIIRKALRSPKNRQVLDWLKSFSLDEEHPDFAASVLRCLGRQTKPGTCSWRTELIRRALTTDDVEIRDAAVQAAESWDEEESANILKSHHEPEPWLREYILDVISDLGK